MAEPEIQFVVRGTAAHVTLTASAIWLGFDPAGGIVVAGTPMEREIGRIEHRNGRFYFTDLDPDHLFLLNGRPVEGGEPEALADGDLLRTGNHEISVCLRGLLFEVEVDSQHAIAGETAQRSGAVIPEAIPTGAVDALREFWDKRSRDKIAQPSPLHPQEPPRPGKARFGWGPTGDLARPWPVAILAWAAIVIVLFSVGAALLYARAFSPGVVSDPHTRRTFERTSATAIASRPNANSCTSCHSLTGSMNTQCASCHQTAAFAATTTGIDAHTRAGIGCVSCHTEHEGAGFSNVRSALVSCAKCHNDGNANTYAGRHVATPHSGTTGYPVVNGTWKWTGLSPAEWAGKPDAGSPALQAAAVRQPNESDDDWRRRQFHTLHVNRVRLGKTGFAGSVNGTVSCSTCHRSIDPADKVTPPTTCAKCHNGDSGDTDGQGQLVVAASAPNCISCHAPHAQEPDHWNPNLFSPLK
jgi:hypothetical protein